MQLNVAAVLAEAKPAPKVFVMDCLPNMQQDSPATVTNATLAVVTQLRAQLGDTVPIVVIEGHRYTNDWIKPHQVRNFWADFCHSGFHWFERRGESTTELKTALPCPPVV